MPEAHALGSESRGVEPTASQIRERADDNNAACHKLRACCHENKELRSYWS